MFNIGNFGENEVIHDYGITLYCCIVYAKVSCRMSLFSCWCTWPTPTAGWHSSPRPA